MDPTGLLHLIPKPSPVGSEAAFKILLTQALLVSKSFGSGTGMWNRTLKFLVMTSGSPHQWFRCLFMVMVEERTAGKS